MSEPTRSDESDDPAADDELRQHTQAETEGSERDESGEDVPREHTQEPAEG